jgi:glutathione S-transferase
MLAPAPAFAGIVVRAYDLVMRLYMLRTCPFAQRAVIALREKNLDFEIAFFDRGQRPKELEELSPRAKSPTLFDGDARVYDSAVVLEYLEERYPERPLLPKDARSRADARMLIARYNDEVTPKYGALLSEVLFKEPRDPTKVEAAKEAFLGALPAWNEYFEGRTFAVGDALTLADVTLYTFFASLKTYASLEIPPALGHLRAWHDRMLARPSSPVPA